MRRRRLTAPLAAALLGVALLAGSGAVADADRSAGQPTFVNHQAPPGVGDRAGEPTLGVNPRTAAVLYQAGMQVLRVTDLQDDGSATWEVGNFPVPQRVSFDPILDMDPETGRAFTSQLLLACSQGGFTDDDGETFTLSEGCGPGSAFDHQSVGFGPYVEGGPLEALKNPVTDYPNVVYYCAQDVATAKCSMSTDGGLTFPVTSVAWESSECQLGGIFGHLKAAPDGTVYLPPTYCPDILSWEFPTGVAVSEDNGLTWEVRRVPGGVGDAGHPSVGVGRDGDVYLAYGGVAEGQSVSPQSSMSPPTFPYGPPMAATSQDKGLTWSTPVDVGADLGIVNTRFPLAVAGDDGRAAVAYLGSTTPGDGGAADFAGRWDLYVSFTTDHGATWRTTNATPDSPVQVGPVCSAGTACGADRNLLDFNDMVVDPATGRVLVAYADGCLKAACTRTDRFAKATISRQVGGPSLYASAPGRRPAGTGQPQRG